MESLESNPTPSPQSSHPAVEPGPPPRAGFFSRLARETREAGAVVMDMLFHPMAHLLAVVAFLSGLIILPMTNAHQLFPGCSFLLSTGLPCPGCGLTRSVMAAYRLDLAMAFRLNPLGPFFALTFLLLGFLLFLPSTVKMRIRQKLKPMEGYVALALVLLFVLVFFHGLARMGFIWLDHPIYSWWVEQFPEGRPVTPGTAEP